MSLRRRRGALALVGLAALFLAYCWLFETRQPVLTAYDVTLPGLPRELDGFRIVQLSDMHRSLVVPDSLIRGAVRLANSTHADIAVLTGDFVSHNANNAKPCAQMLSRIRTRKGLYAVLGNHDHWTNAGMVSKAIKSQGIVLLDNSNARLGTGLYLAGIDDKWAGKPDVGTAFRWIPQGSCRVMVSHTPLAIDLFKGRQGLLITGHTHGGQVLVPFVPRRRLPGLKGWHYIQGWYREGGILMYVNRGIGTVNPPIRFRCQPEVTLYVLHPGEKLSAVSHQQSAGNRG
jgi:uncharacterized protein